VAAALAVVRDLADEAMVSFELDGVSFAPRNRHTSGSRSTGAPAGLAGAAEWIGGRAAGDALPDAADAPQKGRGRHGESTLVERADLEAKDGPHGERGHGGHAHERQQPSPEGERVYLRRAIDERHEQKRRGATDVNPATAMSLPANRPLATTLGSSARRTRPTQAAASPAVVWRARKRARLKRSVNPISGRRATQTSPGAMAPLSSHR
jgi:hypothetical protein